MAPTVDTFSNVVVAALSRTGPNVRQREAVAAARDKPLFVVAGPGTGKTTTLVLRALALTFVDRIVPEDILITTFTKKAGREIRSRLIEWGTDVREHLLGLATTAGDSEYADFLSVIDVNRYMAGTLDSICEEAVRDMRHPSEAPPVVLDESAARALLARRGEIGNELSTVGDELRAYLGKYAFNGDPVRTVSDATTVVRTIVDRLIQDRVDLPAFVGPHQDQASREAILRIKQRYEQHLATTNQLDFALLEQAFLGKLEAGILPRSMMELKAVLVDEYQDTNPLQEAIYFELVRRTNAILTVVGDDDQSLYRFRGATIELFRDFETRCVAALGCETPTLVCLEENYRSSEQIVSFFNDYIQNDVDFSGARVVLPPPHVRQVVATTGPAEIGVLGMFRSNAGALATDLADFLDRLFRQGGRIPRANEDTLAEPILPATDGGDVGDAVFLSHSVNERTRSFMGNEGRDRLPRLLRAELESRGIGVFNPRGRALRDIEIVQRFLGLALESLDPAPIGGGGPIQERLTITNDAKRFLNQWRVAAQELLSLNPADGRGNRLMDRVLRWQNFAAGGPDQENEWPLLDIIYSFLPWFAPFQDDPEAQVYLEAITRTVANASTFSGYKAAIQREDPHRERSIQFAYRDFFSPIAEDLIAVDEEIMPSVPRDRLNIMTIHQAKGLEFPLVIVDVSSDFKQNSPAQRFKRFPEDPSSVALMEDDLAAVTPVGPARMMRDGMQRTFEDLIRLYYVAYSRPQTLLLLVGCQQGLQYRTKIPNVAKFWRRDLSWPWISDPTMHRPPVDADQLPFIRI
ncbi:AAA family ATPase [Altererythrobacter sp. Root672]|nr:AAA family ATPase [Altererythrobacter sp. Root672]